jgi:hypothetical protein
MADPLFREFLAAKVAALKTTLQDTTLSVDDIVSTSSEIVTLSKRIDRMDNPVTRKKKVPAPE